MPGKYEVYEYHIHIGEILKALTKNELIMICRQHKLKGYSQKKKPELIEFIRGHILKPDVLYHYFLCLSDEEAEYMRMEVQSGGVMDDAEPEAFSYLMAGGYAGFTDTLKFGIPTEVVEQFEAFDDETYEQKRSRICLIGNYCHIANYLYAVTPPMQVVKMVNQYERQKTDWQEVMEVYGLISQYRCDFMYMDYYFVDYAFMENYKELLEKQGSLPYYMPSGQELKEWFRLELYVNRDAVFELFIYMTQQLWLKPDFAADVCEVLESTIRVGCYAEAVYQQLLASGVRCHTRRQERELKGLLDHLINNTRMIIYRGFTPAEAARLNKN